MPLYGERKKEYQRQWVAKRRQEWINSQGNKCVKCGSTEQLEVDHIDPNSKVDHHVWSWSKERRETELAKCQILCHDCHKEKTRQQVYKEYCPNGHLKSEVGVYANRRKNHTKVAYVCKVCHNEKRNARRRKTDLL